MFLKQYFLECLAQSSYLIGDEVSGQAAVVDPRRDVDQYVDDAAAQGLRIAHVILTHFQADFISGHLELRDRVGAEIHLGARGEAEYAHTPVHDGDVLDLGDVGIVFRETPGHTVESICALVFDRTLSETKPHAVLTGDTLFIGDVGRPDLMASKGYSAEELAGWLYDSLHDKLLGIPDETLVYPAHGAGSLCGRNMSTDTFSTFGVQRAYNYALQPMTREEFIEIAVADLPPSPAYFSLDAELNRKEHPFRAHEQPSSLSLAEMLSMADHGAQVLDARDSTDFAATHMHGSTNIPLDGPFALWAGSVLDFERPIVLIVNPGGEAEVGMRLARVGLENVAGFLDGGMQALQGHPDLLDRTERITARTLAEQLSSADPPAVVDVRQRAEWVAGHIEGSINIPLGELAGRVSELPDRAFALHCLAAYRSSIAAGILQGAGVTRFTELIGGIEAWEASKLPTVTG